MQITQLIQKAAVWFKWDGKKKVFTASGIGISTTAGRRESEHRISQALQIQSGFRRTRCCGTSKVRCWSTCIDEVLQLFFTTAENRLTYYCNQPIGSTLLMHTDVAFAVAVYV